MDTPTASSAEVRHRMKRQARRDTAPEVALRRRLHALGLRYRLDRPAAPGRRRRADVVFGPAKVAVFVDGCFWHRCPQHGTTPRANGAWWTVKLDANVARDRDTDDSLTRCGWYVVRVWEHEDPISAAERVRTAVLDRRPTSDVLIGRTLPRTSGRS